MPRRALLGEWLILMALVTYRTIGGTLHGPDRLLLWLFGNLPALRFPELQPYRALFLAICNLFLLAGLLLTFSTARWAERARWAVTAWFIFALVVVPVLRDVEIRLHIDEAPGNTQPFRSQSHDGGVVETEQAAAALLHGKNPYHTNYAGTSMARTGDSDAEGWRSTGYDHNPAFDHLSYPPGPILLAAAVSFIVPDVRILYLGWALAFAFLLARRFSDGPERRIAILIALCNPLLCPYLIIGRNEVLVLLPLVLFCDFVSDGRWRAAAWSLGAALTLKQFAVAAIPFVVIARPRPRDLWPMLAVPLVICLPFLVWDARAFLDGTIWWSLGGGADPYPVKWVGWGLSPLGYGLNLVDSPHGANPFGWVSLPAQLAALLLLGRRVWRDPSPSEIFLSSGVLLFVMLFTSRAFTFSYLIVPVLFIAMAWLAQRKEPA